MGFEKFLFYLFSIVMLAAAVMVISSRNPVHSVLFLVLTFFNAAALWMLAEAEFLAIVLVLVYVGAVMVLFLFVVMMLDIDLAVMRAGFVKYLPLGILVAVLIAAELVLIVGSKYFDATQFVQPASKPADFSNTQALGELLYSQYLYPFEIAAVILLVAIIAAISLTLRRRPETKYQNPSRQVNVKKAERVRLIKMESEK